MKHTCSDTIQQNTISADFWSHCFDCHLLFATMSLNPLNVSVQPPVPGEWGTAVDPATGRTYSYNAKTGETRWDDAPVKRVSAIMLQEYTAAKVAPPICPPLHPEWKEIVDPKSGKTFYYHMTTGESQFAFVPAPVTFYSCFTDPCTRLVIVLSCFGCCMR